MAERLQLVPALLTPKARGATSSATLLVWAWGPGVDPLRPRSSAPRGCDGHESILPWFAGGNERRSSLLGRREESARRSGGNGHGGARRQGPAPIPRLTSAASPRLVLDPLHRLPHHHLRLLPPRRPAPRGERLQTLRRRHCLPSTPRVARRSLALGSRHAGRGSPPSRGAEALIIAGEIIPPTQETYCAVSSVDGSTAWGCVPAQKELVRPRSPTP